MAMVVQGVDQVGDRGPCMADAWSITLAQSAPKRSVWIIRGSTPASSASDDAASTKPLDPQMKTIRAFAAGPVMRSASMACPGLSTPPAPWVSVTVTSSSSSSA